MGLKIFQIKTYNGECRVLTPDFATKNFSVQEGTPHGWGRRINFTLVCLPDSTVIVIGGKDSSSPAKYYNTVSQYNIEKDFWRKTLPKLNDAREGAAGCFVNGHIYVVGGLSDNNSWLSSIERLAFDAVSSDN